MKTLSDLVFTWAVVCYGLFEYWLGWDHPTAYWIVDLPAYLLLYLFATALFLIAGMLVWGLLEMPWCPTQPRNFLGLPVRPFPLPSPQNGNHGHADSAPRVPEATPSRPERHRLRSLP